MVPGWTLRLSKIVLYWSASISVDTSFVSGSIVATGSGAIVRIASPLSLSTVNLTCLEVPRASRITANLLTIFCSSPVVLVKKSLKPWKPKIFFCSRLARLPTNKIS